MAITFSCGTCGNTIKVHESLAGRKGKCQQCGAVLVVPDAGPAGAEPVAPPPMATPAYPPTPPAYPPAPPTYSPTSVPMAEIVPSSGGESAIGGVRELGAVKALVDRGSYLDATRALATLEPTHSGNPSFHYMRGLAYTGLGNFPVALDELNRAVQGGVQTPEAYAAKGKAELALQRYDQAIESLDAALDRAGTDVPDYMADLAKAYEGAGMPRDAAATWQALATLNPAHPALMERQQQNMARQAVRHQQQAQAAMVQMQREQRASDTACWICIILRCLLECL